MERTALPKCHGRAIVVGGGVIGLSTAVLLRRRGFRVHVVAAAFSPDTTSDGAAAYWEPLFDDAPENYRRWCIDTYAALCRVAGVPVGGPDVPAAEQRARSRTTGVTLMRGSHYVKKEEGLPFFAECVRGFRYLEGDALPKQLRGVEEAAWSFLAPLVDMSIYMPWLMNVAEKAGISFEKRKIENMKSLESVVFPTGEKPDVVVNCTGLGFAAEDSQLYPARGRVLKIFAPNVDTWQVDVSGPLSIAYVLPRQKCVVVGGTYDKGEWDTTRDKEEEQRFLERCYRLEPKLRGCPILSSWTGLRPSRSSVRLEADQSGSVPIVHNYGHGGAGVTLSWGCAMECADLCMEQIYGDQGNLFRSKL